MKYTSVKKFTLSEEDKDAIIRTRSILGHIYGKMDDNGYFKSDKRMWTISKEDLSNTDGILDSLLTVVIDNNGDIIINEQE